MAIVENFPSFLADFGVAATVDGVAVTGIFDNDYGDPLGLVAGSRPVLQVIASAVPSVDLGDAVTIGALSYTVAEIQPDGTGMTRLVLEKV